MATKEQQGKVSLTKGGQPQQNKTGKESRNTSVGNINCTTDLEQQQSSNKGKGPAGENL